MARTPTAQAIVDELEIYALRTEHHPYYSSAFTVYPYGADPLHKNESFTAVDLSGEETECAIQTLLYLRRCNNAGLRSNQIHFFPTDTVTDMV